MLVGVHSGYPAVFPEATALFRSVVLHASNLLGETGISGPPGYSNLLSTRRHIGVVVLATFVLSSPSGKQPGLGDQGIMVFCSPPGFPCCVHPCPWCAFDQLGRERAAILPSMCRSPWPVSPLDSVAVFIRWSRPMIVRSALSGGHPHRIKHDVQPISQFWASSNQTWACPRIDRGLVQAIWRRSRRTWSLSTNVRGLSHRRLLLGREGPTPALRPSGRPL